MEVNNNDEIQVVIEGLEDIIERDLNKHRGIVEQTKRELEVFKQARSYQVQKKKHYKMLMQTDNKYDKKAMQTAKDMINIDIRHYSDKVDGANQILAFNKNIVDTLEKQLVEQREGLKALAKHRKKELAGLKRRLDEQSN